MPPFKPLPDEVKFPELEREILSFWDERKIFEKSFRIRQGAPGFVFFEGPPTANGKPHPGHVLTRVIKDLFPRYKTMRGFQVRRKAGWDTHGLPVEIEVEKELGISGKADIEKYGIEAFVKKCRESVWTYKTAWDELTRRIGFWIDLDDPYITYSTEYVESVWWALSRIWEKGLLYQGLKSVWYCPRCGTALSSHEVGQGYKDVDDPSVYVKFRLAEGELARLPLDARSLKDVSLLAWTTTPWTLPSNAALAVRPDTEYVLVHDGTEGLVFAKALHKALADKKVFDPKRFHQQIELRTDHLAGGTGVLRYEPLFTVPVDRAKAAAAAGAAAGGKQGTAYAVYAAPFVSLEDGTGIVHIAPAFGEEDNRLGASLGLPFFQEVGPDGRMLPGFPWSGKTFKEADADILQDLKGRGLLARRDQYRHAYPFCWRCDSALLQYARKSWFIRTTSVKEKLLADNDRIRWMPDHIRTGRFGDFLRNNVDWALSRERYWGTPLPIWRCDRCDHTEAVASLAELRAKNPALPADLDPHRPFIDAATYPCPKGDGTCRRVPEVIDCWFDSGAMPFAQWGYPHRGKDVLPAQFPADFISEAIDQTRGWFYTLLAIGTLLEDDLPKVPDADGRPYKTCLVLGHVLDEKGRKMSKRLRNVLDPWTVLDSEGADALRWSFYSSTHPWTSVRFSQEGVRQAQREYLLKLWNVFSFFTVYANLDGFDPRKTGEDDVPFDDRPALDRWILDLLDRLRENVAQALDGYQVLEAASALSEFADRLSNWYLRRSRPRFWASEWTDDKRAAYRTLYECLTGLAKLSAPFTPFLSELLYRRLVADLFPDAPESVHLCDWPASASGRWKTPAAGREKLRRQMEHVLDLVSTGRAARRVAHLKVRQPLSEAWILLNRPEMSGEVRELAHLLAEELNVKQVHFTPEQERSKYVKTVVKPNFRVIGPKYGPLAPKVQKELLAGAWRAADGGIEVTVEGKAFTLTPEEVERELVCHHGLAGADGRYGAVLVNPEITPSLRDEGIVREVVSWIQGIRKEMDLPYEARITLGLSGDASALAACRSHEAMIRGDCLVTDIRWDGHVGSEQSFDLDGVPIRLSVARTGETH